MNRILVTGATGQLGREVVNQLLRRTDAAAIAVLVRDASKAEDLREKGVEIRTGDYDNYNSLTEALKGIDRLYFVSGSDVAKRSLQQENVVKVSKEAGVKHVFYTSFQRKNETETSPIAFVADAHIKTENWLKESGITYTILKHTIYMDMLPMFLGDKLLETGVAYLPAGDGKVAFTLRKDMAEVAAVLLTTDGHENKIYNITNTDAVTLAEVAAEITKVTGKKITYVSPERNEYIQTITDAGVPLEYATMFAGFAEAFKQGEFDQTGTSIETFTGRKPVSIAQFLKEVYSSN